MYLDCGRSNAKLVFPMWVPSSYLWASSIRLLLHMATGIPIDTVLGFRGVQQNFQAGDCM